MIYSKEVISIFVRFIKKHYKHSPYTRRSGPFDHNVTRIVELVISFGMPRQARQVVQVLDGRLSPEEFQVLIEVVAEDRGEAKKLLRDGRTVLSANHYTILEQA